MTSRERVHTVFQGKKPDRLPFNFWMDRNLMAELDKKLGEDFRIAHYGADVIESFFDVDWRFGLTGEYVDDEKTSWNIKPLLDDVKKAKDLVLPDPYKNDIFVLICDDRIRHPEIW